MQNTLAELEQLKTRGFVSFSLSRLNLDTHLLTEIRKAASRACTSASTPHKVYIDDRIGYEFSTSQVWRITGLCNLINSVAPLAETYFGAAPILVSAMALCSSGPVAQQMAHRDTCHGPRVGLCIIADLNGLAAKTLGVPGSHMDQDRTDSHLDSLTLSQLDSSAPVVMFDCSLAHAGPAAVNGIKNRLFISLLNSAVADAVRQEFLDIHQISAQPKPTTYFCRPKKLVRSQVDV